MTARNLTARIHALTAAALLCTSASADTLVTVDGRRYENVYVHESGSLYHVRFPADGSTVHVPKFHVGGDGVTLSDKKERKALDEAWWAKQSRLPRTREYLNGRTADVPAARPAPPKVELNLDVRKHGISAVEGGNGTVVMTNRPKKLAAKTQGRTVFVSSKGVGLLTNMPEKFAGDDEYTAVLIPYEHIDVPERFFRLSPEAAFTSTDLAEIVEHYAKRYRLDSALVYAVIEAESNFNPNAVSRAGARGLMQLMPGTAAEMGVTDPFDPAQNIAGGTQYLRLMFDMFDTETLALAAYNAGPGRIKRLMRIPQNGETEVYVPRVQRFKKKYARGFSPEVRVATGPRHSLDYLPPESAEYVRIVLANGTVTAAENVAEKDTYFLWEFGAQSGIIQKNLVKEIIYPQVAAAAD